MKTFQIITATKVFNIEADNSLFALIKANKKLNNTERVLDIVQLT